MLEIPEKVRPMVSDYKMNLLQLRQVRPVIFKIQKLDTKSRIHRYNLVVFFTFEVFCGEKIHLFKLLQRT